MKQLILNTLLFIYLPILAFGESITLDECQSKARSNYPLVKQYGLIDETSRYTISNANKGYIPQLTLSAKATYQSDVTQIPAALGAKLGIVIPTMGKDQYQAVIEASQLIWDGGIISSQKKITNAGTEVEKKKLEVDLFSLNERVNQLYFGILLLNEQLKQNSILQNELQVNYDRMKALKQNGVANQTDLDALKVEQLNADQRETEIKTTRKSYFLVLSAMTGLKIEESTELKKPEIDLAVLTDTVVRRPELALFDAQSKMYESQKTQLNAGNLPKLGAFIQGGVGKPALNMFNSELSPFYIGGLRLSWNLSGFYSQKNNTNKIEVNKKTVEIQKETFLFNTDLKNKQQKAEIQKLQSSVTNDDEIIRLRGNIKQAASVKVDNGTLTVTDLIREINAEDQAKQLKALHEIQLLVSVYQLKNNINN